MTQENKMGVMPVGRLLISMSVPMMISMLVQALYNVVDSVFVSRINESALTAVSLAFPIQNLMIAIAVGTGVGVNALLSKSLGEKNQKAANDAAENGLFLALLSAAVFLVFGLACSRVFFASQTSDAQIVQYGRDYMWVICVCGFGMFFQVMLDRLLISTGKTLYTMFTQGVGAIINIVLDPLFIFGIGPFPRLEVMGAAVATVIGQIAAMFLSLYFNLAKNHEIRLRLREFRPHAATIGRIYAVGVPSILMSSIGSVMTLAMNNILMVFSSTATAVFGVYFKLQSFVFMPVFGLNNGMVPIISYNYGAQRRSRVTQTIKYATIYAVAIMLVGLAIFQLAPDLLLGFFNPSEDMLRIGRVALRIISLSFLLAGFSIVCSSVFQALGHGVLSLLVSVGRQLVVLVPVAWLLSLTGRLELVWWSFPIAEVMSAALCVVFLRRVNREVLAKLEEPASAEA